MHYELLVKTKNNEWKIDGVESVEQEGCLVLFRSAEGLTLLCVPYEDLIYALKVKVPDDPEPGC